MVLSINVLFIKKNFGNDSRLALLLFDIHIHNAYIDQVEEAEFQDPQR